MQLKYLPIYSYSVDNVAAAFSSFDVLEKGDAEQMFGGKKVREREKTVTSALV